MKGDSQNLYRKVNNFFSLKKLRELLGVGGIFLPTDNFEINENFKSRAPRGSGSIVFRSLYGLKVPKIAWDCSENKN